MENIKLSAIIPSYKDPTLQKTIDSLLENSELGDGLEVVCVLDGYWPTIPLKDDKRVRVLHLGANRGMRGAINAGVAISRGEFIARFDEHIMVCKSWDKILVDTFKTEDKNDKSHWIVTGRRFALDPVKWEIMQDIPPVDYSRLVIQDCGNGIRKFAGQEWKSRAKERTDIMCDETEAMQGSMWCMSKKHWDEVIVELETEGYGPHYGDSHEMVFKTWKSGGKLIVNKAMWYVHKHRSFPRTHNDGSPENPANKINGWAYSLSIWENYYNELKQQGKL